MGQVSPFWERNLNLYLLYNKIKQGPSQSRAAMPVTERNPSHGPRTESKLRTESKSRAESESRIPAGACSPRAARSRRRACRGAAAPQANGRDAGWVARRGAAASGKNDGARWGWVGCVGVAGVGGAGGRAVRAGGQPVRGGPAGHGHVHGLGRPRRPAHPPAGNSSTLCLMKGGGGVDRPTLQQATAPPPTARRRNALPSLL